MERFPTTNRVVLTASLVSQTGFGHGCARVHCGPVVVGGVVVVGSVSVVDVVVWLTWLQMPTRPNPLSLPALPMPWLSPQFPPPPPLCSQVPPVVSWLLGGHCCPCCPVVPAPFAGKPSPARA